MSETQGVHGSMSVGETNTLIGSNNYHIWQLKMKVILRRKNLWDLIDIHIQPDYFLTMNLGTQYTRQTMRKTKNLTLSKIQLFIVWIFINFQSPNTCSGCFML
jgi:hypothetical protein